MRGSIIKIKNMDMALLNGGRVAIYTRESIKWKKEKALVK